jgi:hypothetical protein
MAKKSAYEESQRLLIARERAATFTPGDEVRWKDGRKIHKGVVVSIHVDVGRVLVRKTWDKVPTDQYVDADKLALAPFGAHSPPASQETEGATSLPPEAPTPREPPVVPQETPTTVDRHEITIRQRPYLGARLLITIGPGDRGWRPVPDDAMPGHVLAMRIEKSGAIVRLCPPPGTSSEFIAIVVGMMRESSVAVRVVPPGTAPAVIVPMQGTEPPMRARARDIVLDMASEAVGVDRDVLAAFCAHILDHEGI